MFELETGFEKVKPEGSPATPWRKTRDRVRFDLLYARFLPPASVRMGAGLNTRLQQRRSVRLDANQIGQSLLFRYSIGS